MTVQTETNTQQLYFDVEHAHVNTLGLTGIKGRDHAVIVNPGTEDKIISLCSENYELVKNEVIFPQIESNFAGKEFKTNVQNYNDAAFQVDYIFPIEGLDFFKGENLQFRLGVGTSYDTTKKFDLSAGLFRELCGNGLAVPLAMAAAQEFKLEMSGQHSYDNVKKMLESFSTWLPDVLARFPQAMKEAFTPLHDTMVKDYSERILEVVSATKVFSTKLVEDAVAIAKTEQIVGNLESRDWLAYNAINNLLFDDEVNKKNDWDRRGADQKVLEYMLATVQR
jgi:hypothetical protein